MITLEELEMGEEVATCPSCSLIVRVIYDQDDLPDPDEAKVPAGANREVIKA